MSMKVDCTAHGCVVVCTDCPHWFAFREGREEAWRAARDHERRAHPGAHQAANVLTNRRTRKHA